MKSKDIISVLIRALLEVHEKGVLAKETAFQLFKVVMVSVGDVGAMFTQPMSEPATAPIVGAGVVDTEVARLNIDDAAAVMQTQRYFWKLKSTCGMVYRTLNGYKKNHFKSCKAQGSGCSLETTMSRAVVSQQVNSARTTYRTDIQGWLKNKDTPSPLGVGYTVVEIGLR